MRLRALTCRSPGDLSSCDQSLRRRCDPRVLTCSRPGGRWFTRWLSCLGVPIVLPWVSPQPYSRLAFEGFAYAEERRLGQRYTERIFTAFFVKQRDIGKAEILADVAAELGLDADNVRAALESGRYAEAHQQALRRAQALEITVVPTFLVDGRRLEGVPSAEALHRLLNGAVAIG
jgi:predicted DsbA family dithiol-disulfide isomerase